MHRTVSVLYSCLLRAKNWYSFPFDWPVVAIPKKMRIPSMETQALYHKHSLGIRYRINSGNQRVGSRWAWFGNLTELRILVGEIQHARRARHVMGPPVSLPIEPLSPGPDIRGRQEIAEEPLRDHGFRDQPLFLDAVTSKHCARALQSFAGRWLY